MLCYVCEDFDLLCISIAINATENEFQLLSNQEKTTNK